ncbi:MAG TPA: hypothetical protein VKU44_08775 [Terriglobia bacterium]|nr:hypothetical protein [Terriglobia bacterium]
MAGSAEFRNGIASHTAPPSAGAEGSVPDAVWARIKLVLTRTVFWSYERGSWHYDIICAVILAFIFLTPRAWFHDRPTLQLSDLRHVQGVVEIGQGKNWRSYQIDSRLVDSLGLDKPEDAIRQILERRSKTPFTLKSFEPIRDKNNVILGYTVVVAQ